MKNHNYLKGVILILLAAICWSSAGLLIKLSELPSLQITFYRSLIAGIFLIGFFFWSRYKRRIRFKLSIDRQSILTAFFYTGTVSLFVTANKLTTAANAVFLQYMAPIYVILISYLFLKEKVFFHEVLTVILCLAGMGLFFVDEEKSTAVIGNIVGILSGIAFALLQLSVKRTDKHRKVATRSGDSQIIRELRATFNLSLGNLMTVMLIGTLIFVLSLIPNGNAATTAGESVVKSFSMTMTDFYVLIFLGIGQLGLGYILFAKGVHYISSVEVAIYTLLEPICNPLWTFLGTGEQPGFWAMAGGGTVIGALLFNSVLHYFRKKSDASEE